MNMTIKELSDELGVSKQAIRKHINQLPPTFTVTKENGVYILNPSVVEYIKGKVTSKKQPVIDNLPPTDNQQLIEENDFLKEQIKLKDEQINDWTNLSKSLRTERLLIEEDITKKRKWWWQS